MIIIYLLDDKVIIIKIIIKIITNDNSLNKNNKKVNKLIILQ